MTCYETLRTPAPAADAPMAHHFVKWWRNKFRNGYKKFSIGTESERTDTEELVGRASSQCSAPPDLLPSGARLQHSTAPVCSGSTPHEPACRIPPSPNPGHGQGNDEKRPRLRFEELTCDVELQHPESSKQQPLQFSFTLYDLDGHGRMTKDDIAGIVSTIYESIGKSVTVPHYGSKTIQVRLTVVPDDGSARSTRERREARRTRRREVRQTQTASRPAPEYHPCSDDEVERLSLEEDLSSKSSCSAERKPQKRPLSCEKTRRRDHRHRREKRERKQIKKRSGSLQRRELLEIIQANMEKNRLSFQAPRKPSEPVVNEEEIANKYQKIRNRSYTVSDKPVNAFQKLKSENTPEGYLDLASGGCGGDSNLCRYDRYLHAVICSSAKHAHTGYHQKQHTPRPRAHHHSPRSRSHDRAAPHTSQPRVLQIILL